MLVALGARVANGPIKDKEALVGALETALEAAGDLTEPLGILPHAIIETKDLVRPGLISKAVDTLVGARRAPPGVPAAQPH